MILTNPLPNSILKKYPNGDILQLFGENWRPYKVVQMKNYDGETIVLKGHKGIDIYLPKPHDVVSAHKGYVSEVAEDKTGRRVRVRSNKTGDYYLTSYGHLDDIVVQLGQEIEAGQKIGTIGNSGFSISVQQATLKSATFWGNAPSNYGVHLHFEIVFFENYKIKDINNGFFGCIDPLQFIKKPMIKDCIIHHTAVSFTKNPDQFKATDLYHKTKWNSKSSLGFYVGYHYEISKGGLIRQARKDDEVGLHTIGHNFDSIGIALDGNFDIESPSEAQMSALRDLVSRLDNLYHFKGIYGHRAVSDKTCPGKNLTDTFIKSLIKKPMILGIDKNKDQYLIDTETKIALTIGDEKQLAEIKQHYKFAEPIKFDTMGYLVYRGATALGIKEFFNL